MSGNVEIIRDVYAAFANGDGAAVLAIFSPDIVWNEAENFPYADQNPLGRYGARNSATGKDLDAQFAHIWWLEGGKVTRFEQYTDTAQAIEAVS